MAKTYSVGRLPRWGDTPSCPALSFSLFNARVQGEKMKEFIGFVLDFVLYLGALWFFLESADLSIRMIA